MNETPNSYTDACECGRAGERISSRIIESYVGSMPYAFAESIDSTIIIPVLWKAECHYFFLPTHHWHVLLQRDSLVPT